VGQVPGIGNSFASASPFSGIITGVEVVQLGAPTS
jgi:hypothetical protein